MRDYLRFLIAAALALVPAASLSQAPSYDPSEMARAWQLSQGQERIINFVSDVRIEKNGDLDVTETIRIVSLMQEIRHGIQRDFPTTYDSRFGQKTRTTFDPVSVSLDGREVPWERIALINGVRLRIGDPDKMLSPALHTYVIRYRTSRQIFYGKDSDELYWNATGNGWTFPIDKAEAIITLPSEKTFGARTSYTGPQGSTANAAEVADERPGRIVFRTTAPLGREEGLTISASFPKGVLDAPGTSRRLSWWMQDWGAIAAAVLAFAGLIAFYIRLWADVGRNPRAGTIVPTFAPPDGLTPAAARYISRMKFDDRAYSAAIVDLGVKGHLHISQEEGGWFSKGTTTLRRTGTGTTGPLAEPERAMLAGLFGPSGTIELKQENHSVLRSARTSLEDGLKAAYEGSMFKTNQGWAWIGLGVIAGAMFFIAAIAVMAGGAGGMVLLENGPFVAVAAFASAWWMRRRIKVAEGGARILAWTVLVLAIGIGVTSAIGTIFAAIGGGALVVLTPLVMLPVALTAFRWIYAPTREGRAVMDRIAGFRQYLGIAEEDRLETMHPPEKTPELFERYLPYAIALDVENRWAERFAGVLATAAATGAAAGTAGWYSGSDNFWNNPSSFAGSMGDSLASTVSSASTSPSSSGSSGGGSSGGGGGGGGGSGW